MGNYAGNRSRPERKYVTLSHDELNFLTLRIAKSGNPPFTTFARNSLLTSKMVHVEFTNTKKMLEQLSRIGNNLNQIAHRANETEKVTGEDMTEVKNEVYDLFTVINDNLLHRLDLVQRYERVVLNGNHENTPD
ncbi:plasmid mobilization relaxosome protein MobC (plasmid) [Lacticaseibacillus paracasei subsp. tolerans]|uniref:MobC family plasmid mobilization relaxosome protein n=1 Tax=Lacticaseibacillus paracasei TaxID=1597 RepID=UPI001892BF97|nr:MobC family plasmid mobilization relaxosome protein [Lacticaseibacillus paracasei]QPC20413.1 plasmid mobilization relaxosome protein MobC [Lacticaseibacillus paracasei subsp. tolerans]